MRNDSETAFSSQFVQESFTKQKRHKIFSNVTVHSAAKTSAGFRAPKTNKIWFHPQKAAPSHVMSHGVAVIETCQSAPVPIIV